MSQFSLFQALGSWGQVKEKVIKRKNEEDSGEEGMEAFYSVSPPLILLLLALFSPQLLRAWNRLVTVELNCVIIIAKENYDFNQNITIFLWITGSHSPDLKHNFVVNK